jgi:ABC-type multidrug transport system fused ATPase/permease subunit
MMPFVWLFCFVIVEIGHVAAFTVPLAPLQFNRHSLIGTTDHSHGMRPASALEAVKKKMSAAAAAALAAIDQEEGKTKGKAAAPSWEGDEDDTPSLKDLKKAAKKGKQKQQIDIEEVVSSMATHEDATADHQNGSAPNGEKLSKRDAMLQKALALEEADAASSSQQEPEEPKLSGKELKALKKKEEKVAAKLEKKKAKKNAVEEDEDDDVAAAVVGSSDDLDVSTSESFGDNSDSGSPEEAVEVEITLEDKIRKERPPPRIRVMDNVQAGFTSLRLENVGITFRNQEVLKDVTWGVQTGDRIGLVGANGAGK